MSNDDLERRLAALDLEPPPADTRARVLARVHASLAAPRVAAVDRVLSHRAPWLAAAALLLLLLGANALLERRAHASRESRRAAIESDARSMLEYLAWVARRAQGDVR